MKATGIVKRIDDLGRIVIPEEIKKVIRIKKGDRLEFFITSDKEIILKSTEPNKMQEIEVFDYFNSLGEEDKKQLIKALMDNL